MADYASMRDAFDILNAAEVRPCQYRGRLLAGNVCQPVRPSQGPVADGRGSNDKRDR